MSHVALYLNPFSVRCVFNFLRITDRVFEPSIWVLPSGGKNREFISFFFLCLTVTATFIENLIKSNLLKKKISSKNIFSLYFSRFLVETPPGAPSSKRQDSQRGKTSFSHVPMYVHTKPHRDPQPDYFELLSCGKGSVWGLKAGRGEGAASASSSLPGSGPFLT